MKAIVLSCVIAVATAGAASAQGFYIGPNGVGVDAGPRYGYESRPRRDRVVRQWEDDEGCTVRLIRSYRPDGDVVTRRIRSCDDD